MPVNWQDVLTNVGTTLVSGTVVVGAAAWVVKTLLSDRLARQAEAFKMQVKADADAANERLRNSLQMMALEHQVRFSALHEKRAAVIEDLDRRLYELEVEGQRYVESVGRGGGEEYIQWRNKFIECNSLLQAKQIYLTEQIYSLVSQYLDAVKRPLINVWAITSVGDRDLLQRYSAVILSAVEDAGTKKAMRYALIKEFRAILGGVQ